MRTFGRALLSLSHSLTQSLSPSSRHRRLTALTLSYSLALAFAFVASSVAAQPQPKRELNPTEQAAHAISRLTYGARPGEVTRVTALGVDKWIERQLRPSTIPDSAVSIALSSLQSWTADASTLAALGSAATSAGPRMMQSEGGMMMMTDTTPVRRVRTLSYLGPANEFVAGRIVRAQLSERQLDEVMAEFWLNHFSVYSGKMPSAYAIVVFTRDVIRPHTLGKFRDLLGAVAHSPAMLYYLDNTVNRSDSLHRTLDEYRAGTTAALRNAATRRQGLNENYARELLELHTLGVNGGYTQADVIEVARALTGWSTAPNGGPAGRASVIFGFNESMHDAEAKTVLGQSLAAGRGVEDGEQVLDIIARHPSTARLIATKLARRFVSDSPPPALIARAAETFTRTDGNIAEVVRTIVTSSEFFSRAAFRAKVKTPFELVVSTRRALNAPADTSVASARTIASLGQPTFGYETPEGWPDNGVAWMNSGAMFSRLAFAFDVADGRLKFLPTAGWDGWRAFGSAPTERQVEGVINLLLSGTANSATRDLMLATSTPATALPGGTPSRTRLRELIEIALSSPEFQRR